MADSDTRTDSPKSQMLVAPSNTWRFLDLRELWRYRELFYFLAWRDVKVRYKQTILGGAWAVLQPLLMMVAFTFMFQRIAKVDTNGIPYPVYVFAGLLPWIYFSNSISQATNSLVASQNLITKVYFPRVILPAASIGASLFDFAIAFGVIAVMMLWYGVPTSFTILLLPIFVMLISLAAAGFAVLLSGLAVAYRDVRYVMPFLVQAWLFLTPSVYTSAESLQLSRAVSLLLAVNPAHGLILNFRAAIFGTEFDAACLGVSTASAAMVFILGGITFRRVERRFADII
ncbi:MAG: ABC transporter permease [Pirellulales bacterium]|nr:ABC transporter permease [Pirellulales bacterium]